MGMVQCIAPVPPVLLLTCSLVILCLRLSLLSSHKIFIELGLTLIIVPFLAWNFFYCYLAVDYITCLRTEKVLLKTFNFRHMQV